MSTILKALRRLEEDRSLVADRPLREAVATQHHEEKPSRKGFVLAVSVLGVGVAVGAGALAFLSVRSGHAMPTVAVAPAPAALPTLAARTVAAERPRAMLQNEPAPSRGAEVRLLADDPAAIAIAVPPPPPLPEPVRELSPGALASEVKVLDRPGPVPRIADPDAEAKPATSASVAAAPPPVPADPPPVPATPSPVPAEPPPAVSLRRSEPSTEMRAAAVSAPQVARQEWIAPASPPAPKAAAKPAPKPVVAEKPAVRAPAPSKRLANVRVEETRWHPDAARRTAVVEMEVGAGTREVHEGDALGSLVVSKIEPSGVIFQQGDVEVRRKIGQ